MRQKRKKARLDGPAIKLMRHFRRFVVFLIVFRRQVPPTQSNATRPKAIADGSGTTKTGVKLVGTVKLKGCALLLTRKIVWSPDANVTGVLKTMLL